MKHQHHQQSAEPPVYRNQLITKGDLYEFKDKLLEELTTMVRDIHDRGGKKWLRSADVRKILSISHGTLQNMRINGDLPFTKVGGVIFYDRKDIDQMITAGRTHADQ